MTAHNLKDIRDQFRATGKFHTPPDLAKFLHDLIPNPDNVRNVYDPTCGTGSLLEPFPEETPKFGQDIDITALEDANYRLKNFTGRFGDVLKHPGFKPGFHAIVANPPFSIPWEPNGEHEQFNQAPTLPTRSRADFAFLMHILHILDEDGTAAVLQFPGVLYRSGREQKLRQWFIETNVIDQIHDLPGDQFVDTEISAVALVLKKNRKPGQPILMVDRVNNLSKEITPAEIAENDYTLSVTNFVQPPPPKVEPINPIELEKERQTLVVENARKSLKWAKVISKLENNDFHARHVEAFKEMLKEEHTNQPNELTQFDLAKNEIGYLETLIFDECERLGFEHNWAQKKKPNNPKAIEELTAIMGYLNNLAADCQKFLGY